MKKISLIIFSLFFLFLTCKDDDHPVIIMDDDGPPEPPITEYPCLDALDSLAIPAVNIDTLIDEDSCPIPLYEIYPEKYRYTYPCFNPNNVEELAFIRTENETFKSNLCVLNLCDGQLNCFEVNHLDNLDWGTNNWILFIGRDLQVWKIKPDGTSLTMLTSNGENATPSWNGDGDKIAYSLTNTGEFIIIGSNGNVIEINESMQYRGTYDWSYSNKLITPFEPGSADDIYYYDLDQDTLVKVDEEGNGAYIHDGEWGQDERLYWLVKFQLAYTDIKTKERTSIFELPVAFNNRRYCNFTISPDNQYIVLSREDWKQIDDCSAEVVHSLYIMDIDGANERKILIPE